MTIELTERESYVVRRCLQRATEQIVYAATKDAPSNSIRVQNAKKFAAEMLAIEKKFYDKENE